MIKGRGLEDTYSDASGGASFTPPFSVQFFFHFQAVLATIMLNNGLVPLVGVGAPIGKPGSSTGEEINVPSAGSVLGVND